MIKAVSYMLVSLGLLTYMVVYHNAPKTEIKPKISQISTIEEEPHTLTVATMVFTAEEACELIEQIRNETTEPSDTVPSEQTYFVAASEPANAGGIYSASYFKRAGVIHWGGWRWTWYSERILPGNGLRIPGRHTDAQGFVRDSDGLLCLATDVLRRGTVMDTPFGLCKVYDCGCGSTIDVYVGW